MKNFVVYKSSAGSGKTFTLVKEYLRLSLYDNKQLTTNFRRILAVTFTNKAAAEMKSRVLSYLSELSGGQSPQPLTEMLCADLKVDAAELARRSAIVLRAILHNYSEFSIGTIDSFTHRIVRTFAHDLELPLNFNVELDEQAFFEKVLASLVADMEHDPYVSRLLRDFALNNAEDNAAWDPQRPMEQFAAHLQKENAAPYIARLKKLDAEALEKIRKELFQSVSGYRIEVKRLAGEALALISKNNIDESEFIGKERGPQNFFRKCYNLKATADDATGSTISKTIRDNRWTKNGHPVIDAIAPDLTRLARELTDYIISNYSRYKRHELLARQMVPIMLLRKIEEIAAERKAEERLVFISEFNRRIAGIIETEPTPYIYERLGERYHHYLLDEFQDTSAMQWMNMLPLIDNSLAGGWYNLVVGDGKQSIYRWRNADVTQFAILPEIKGAETDTLKKERANTLRRNFHEAPLNKNFRSLENIVAFNNRFFEFVSREFLNPEQQIIYRDQVQTPMAGSGGYITVDRGKFPAADLHGQTLDALLKHIHAAREDQFEYGDICILCRRNADGHEAAEFLSKKGIPVVSSESLLLKHCDEVNVLVSCLRYLAFHDDHISAAAVLRYLWLNGAFDVNTLHGMLRELSAGKSLFTLLAGHSVMFDIQSLTTAGVADACTSIISRLGLSTRAPHYIRFFMDEVYDFTARESASVPRFVEWWEQRANKASLILPDNRGSVKVMTVHASKGLEFPVVIIPYCNWNPYLTAEQWVEVNDEASSLPVSVIKLTKDAENAGFGEACAKEKSDQLMDTVNIAYVAFTRAAERLHIISYTSRNLKEAVSSWLDKFIDSEGATGEVPYVVGTRQPPHEKRKSSLPFHSLTPLKFSERTDRLKIRSSWLHRLPEGTHTVQEGLVIHDVLSRVRHAGDISQAIRDCVMEGVFSESASEAISAKIKRIITHPKLQFAFAEQATCKLEAELITADGKILRPDRVVFETDRVVIIDYKTGARRDVYHRQLRGYAEALHAMGHQNVTMLIVYIDEAEIEEVDAATLNSGEVV